jgi:hypothetical protein
MRTLAAQMKEPALEGQQGRLTRIARAFGKDDQRLASAQGLRHGVDGRRRSRFMVTIDPKCVDDVGRDEASQ